MGSIIGSIAPMCAPCNFPGDALMYPSTLSSTQPSTRPSTNARPIVAARLELVLIGLDRFLWTKGGTPAHYTHECENKRVAKWVPRKCMKRKRRFSLG